tara:strand:+ start:444 stop:860 length:417 start_codon:yes stop_codon:yes gene_type:complete
MSESLRTSRSLLEESAKVLRGEMKMKKASKEYHPGTEGGMGEMTDAQKKLPPALQKAIKAKEKSKDEEMMPKKDMMKKKDEGSHFDDKMKKKEELSDAQKKMDMNKNGKIDGEDLAKLRAKKEQLEEIIKDLESKLEE